MIHWTLYFLLGSRETETEKKSTSRVLRGFSVLPLSLLSTDALGHWKATAPSTCVLAHHMPHCTRHTLRGRGDCLEADHGAAQETEICLYGSSDLAKVVNYRKEDRENEGGRKGGGLWCLFLWRGEYIKVNNRSRRFIIEEVHWCFHARELILHSWVHSWKESIRKKGGWERERGRGCCWYVRFQLGVCCFHHHTLTHIHWHIQWHALVSGSWLHFYAMLITFHFHIYSR